MNKSGSVLENKTSKISEILKYKQIIQSWSDFEFIKHKE